MSQQIKKNVILYLTFFLIDATIKPSKCWTIADFQITMVIERPQPIIEQVITLLRKRIRDREFSPDNRFPSESSLAEELGVSRTTVRSALAALATEKLIIRRQGDGTYVNTRFIDVTTRFGTIWEFTNIIEANGHQTSIEALKVERRAATHEESCALEIDEGEQVLDIVRLFCADEIPVIYSINVISGSYICDDISPEQVEEPLPVFFKKYCSHEEFTYGIATINSIIPKGEIAGLLNIDEREPVLRFIEVFYNASDDALVFAKNYLNDKKITLQVARSFS